MYTFKWIKQKLFLFIVFVFIFCFCFHVKNSDKCFDEIREPMRRIATKKCHVNNSHSTCFLNKLFCHPGYTGVDCSTRQIPANPWYTDDCPNLKESITFRIDMPIDMISKGETCKNQEKINDLAECG